MANMEQLEISFKKSSMIQFLKSISIFSDRVIFDISDNKIVATTHNNECVYRDYYNNITLDTDIDTLRLNIPDVIKLYKFFDSLPDEQITLKYNNNQLIYSSKYIKLKYHLLDNGIINEVKMNINKALKLDYDILFDIDKDTIGNILKLTSFNNTENKLYFYTNDNNLYCDIADKTKTNTDELSLCIKEDVSYNFNGMIIPSETVRIINTTLFDKIDMKLNTKLYIMLASINNDDYEINYIISGREK